MIRTTFNCISLIAFCIRMQSFDKTSPKTPRINEEDAVARCPQMAALYCIPFFLLEQRGKSLLWSPKPIQCHLNCAASLLLVSHSFPQSLSPPAPQPSLPFSLAPCHFLLELRTYHSPSLKHLPQFLMLAK